MKNVMISLAIGAGALFGTAANAAPLSSGISISPDSGIENVRLVCDEYGRCYRTRGGRRVVIQQGYDNSYDYAPRERYERRGYYDGGPSVGVGVGPGGVGIGFGAGPRW